MDISDMRVKLIRDPGERLKAVCVVTFDGAFVVRDVKVVEGANGLFVAMPSQKLALHCPQCNQKNHLRARYCNECGTKLPPNRIPSDANSRSRLHRDIAHPIRASFRELLQNRVIQAYKQELERAQSPDYQPASLDTDSDEAQGQEQGREVSRTDDYDAMIANLRNRASGSSTTWGSTARSSDRPETSEEPAEYRRSRRRRRGRRSGHRTEERPGDVIRPEPVIEPEADAADDTADEPQTTLPGESEAPSPAEDATRDKASDRSDSAADQTPFGHGIL